MIPYLVNLSLFTIAVVLAYKLGKASARLDKVLEIEILNSRIRVLSSQLAHFYRKRGHNGRFTAK